MVSNRVKIKSTLKVKRVFLKASNYNFLDFWHLTTPVIVSNQSLWPVIVLEVPKCNCPLVYEEAHIYDPTVHLLCESEDKGPWVSIKRLLLWHQAHVSLDTITGHERKLCVPWRVGESCHEVGGCFWEKLIAKKVLHQKLPCDCVDWKSRRPKCRQRRGDKSGLNEKRAFI